MWQHIQRLADLELPLSKVLRAHLAEAGRSGLLYIFHIRKYTCTSSCTTRANSIFHGLKILCSDIRELLGSWLVAFIWQPQVCFGLLRALNTRRKSGVTLIGLGLLKEGPVFPRPVTYHSLSPHQTMRITWNTICLVWPWVYVLTGCQCGVTKEDKMRTKDLGVYRLSPLHVISFTYSDPLREGFLKNQKNPS